MVACCDEGVVACLDNNNKDYLDAGFSLQNPWNNFFREPLVVNEYSSMAIQIKISGLIPMTTSVVTITIKPQWYTNITWMMGGRGDGMRPISTPPITVNTLSTIVKWIVADLLRPDSTSCTVTPTITSSIFMKTIIKITRSTRHMQQYTMVT